MYLTRAGYLKTKCVVSALKLLTLGCGNVFYTFSIYIAGIVSIWGLAAFSLGTKVPRTQGIRDVSISKYFGELLCEILCMNAQDLLCIPEYSSSCNSCNLRECKIVTLVWKILEKVHEVSVQFSSVSQLGPTLFDPMNRSMPGLPVHHQLPEFTQTHVHWVGDAFQPSHPLLSPSPPAPNPSQHQSLFQWVNFSHEVAKELEFHL